MIFVSLILKKDADHRCYINAEIVIDPTTCKSCNTGKLIKNGSKTTLYRDIPLHGLFVGIYLKRRRYKCKDCGATLYQHSCEMHEKALMTNRLHEYIYKNAFNKTFQSVADEIGLDEKTVRRIFKESLTPEINSYKPITPTILGIDEAHLIGKARCVITNVKEKCLIDMLVDRNKVALSKYISNLPDRHKISVVSIDMWRPYHSVVKALLPHAVVVIDKFHVVKLAQEALEKARKSIKSALSHKERKQLKNDRYLLLKHQRDLSEMEKIILYDWFGKFPQLEQVYVLKEAFFCIFELSDRKKALAAYDTWLTLIDDNVKVFYESVAKTVSNWKDEIFNYFDYQYTNACTEAINGLIKLINKNGRGYSFDVLRAKGILSLQSRKYKERKTFKRYTQFEQKSQDV